MYRGTTPTLTFEIPFDTSLIEEAYVTLSQNDIVIIDVPVADLELSDNVITCNLSQNQTLSLSANSLVDIQLRIRTTSEDALTSRIFKVPVSKILKDGEI